MNASITASANSITEIQKRIAAGKITWAGTLIMLSARTVIGLICQTLVAVLFFRGSADPWMEAAGWWKVYGTLVDVGCIVLLVWLTRREGIRLFDLGNYRREGWLRDVGIGLALFVPGLLINIGVIMAAFALLGYTPPAIGIGLPMWAILYSLIIWPIIWGPTEDNTYVGYSMSRVEALTGRKWPVVVVLSFFAFLQHAFFPFLGLDWRPIVAFLVWSVPSTVWGYWWYKRLRRLLPFHVTHWLIDVASMLPTLLMASPGGG